MKHAPKGVKDSSPDGGRYIAPRQSANQYSFLHVTHCLRHVRATLAASWLQGVPSFVCSLHPFAETRLETGLGVPRCHCILSLFFFFSLPLSFSPLYLSLISTTVTSSSSFSFVLRRPFEVTNYINNSFFYFVSFCCLVFSSSSSSSSSSALR